MRKYIRNRRGHFSPIAVLLNSGILLMAVILMKAPALGLDLGPGMTSALFFGIIGAALVGMIPA